MGRIFVYLQEMMAYSDFPPPTHFPNHMHHSFVLRYLEMYAEKFDLLKYIRFETRVIQVSCHKQWWIYDISAIVA